MNFYHVLPLQIRFNDIDLAQHVNNSVYQEYFDLGRLSYFEAVMGTTLAFDGLSMVIASFRVDFFLPVFLSDKIFVRTKVVSTGNKSLEMVQQIVGEGDSAPRAEAMTIMVCYNYGTQASEVLPETWKSAFSLFEHHEIASR